MTTGEALRSILGIIGMSQTELAKRSGISLKHVNQVVRGNASLSADMAVAFSDAVAEHLIALEAQGQMRKARARRARYDKIEEP